jgi:ferredoxin
MKAKARRKIIVIDEERCDGCEACIPSCPEGALQIVDTPGGPKARLVKESFCDGLGACLGECPQDALSVVEMETEAYDEKGVISHIKEHAPGRLDRHMEHLKAHAQELHEGHGHAAGPAAHACPSAAMQCWGDEQGAGGRAAGRDRGAGDQRTGPALAPELRQWPVQLHLVSPHAPYFKEADFVLVADCVPFAYADFHRDFLKGRAVAVACPKLDNVRPYVDKIAGIIEEGRVRSLTVVVMEVPCCSGLVQFATEALRKAGRDIPFEVIVVGIRGEILTRKRMDKPRKTEKLRPRLGV